ncbi:putative receptor protein kinase ZmPK1 [Malania oleifera]|uniref:putative receptor protein kinase ZmPK1 n=1 Tax=Malania oleifera TaxID=397392 RepID=UPI0025ADA5BF|nr:putative receptor protein kinase ZmPK1 [Malania oleifera]
MHSEPPSHCSFGGSMKVVSCHAVSTILLLSLFLVYPSSSSASSTNSSTLTQGSSLSVDKLDHVLLSPNGVFTAGFYSVGNNAFCFAIWYTKSAKTSVWMANRDYPVNGRRSKLSLSKKGNLILSDADRRTVWTTGTFSASSVLLNLTDRGNLVVSTSSKVILWQSFDRPTDTLLPGQSLTKDTALVSARSQKNHSSGFYKFYFDNDNVIRLLFDGPEYSSVYWPDPRLLTWDAGRSTYNSSRIAVLDSSGHFRSSDDLEFRSADYGSVLSRRLTIDFDGNVRLYSLDEERWTWVVSWQALPQPCQPHGICGPNSICTYAPASGSSCSCIPGFKFKNSSDWSHGCEPQFNLSCHNHPNVSFLELPHVKFYGNDYKYYGNYTFEQCKNKCIELQCDCKAFLVKYSKGKGYFNCYPKTLLLNGYHSPEFRELVHLKLPGSVSNVSEYDKRVPLNCTPGALVQLDRTFQKKDESGVLRFLLCFACTIGGVEITFIFLVWCLLIGSRENSDIAEQGYRLAAATVFKKFTYAELKKATRGFREEIGRGGAGIVYKGVLYDHRIAAIKRLNGANQGEAEFFAEISSIGRLNHRNLIELWGYCAEGKHRLLVYEYMEHGSLAENLASNALDWEKRFEIAVGTAKGLAYLHEECLEWVLHCDVKPQNILLDSNYRPKVADFGLSKLLNRGGFDDSGFSTMRGTRGYMAPEWLLNQSITSKVDVYSFGIVMLEMVTGRNAATSGVQGSGREMQSTGLVTWVRKRMISMNGAAETGSGLEGIRDPIIASKHDRDMQVEKFVAVALQCVEEDKDARPTMSQVVEMLLLHT